MNYIELKTWLTLRINKTFVKDSAEYDLLFTLLQKHPSYDKWKFKIPIAFKIIKKNAVQLLVSFIKNKYRIVSWVSCVKNKSKIDPLTSAMRQAIKRQISIYKRNNLDKKCVLCESIVKIEVDHIVKFSLIKNDFLNGIIAPVGNGLTAPVGNGLSAPTTFDYHPKRGYYMFRKGDIKWKTQWQKYHLKTATYRYLCSSCNKKN